MSAVYDINYKSKLMHMPVRISVILPDLPDDQKPAEFYASGKKYKVLWLLHGGSGDNFDWLYFSNIVRHAAKRDVIVVSPNALDSDFANQPQFAGGWMFADFFFDELMPYIHGFFPASDKPEDNFITGLSMGGAGTLMLTFMHPEKFGGMAPLSCSLRKSPFLEDMREMTSSEFRTLAMEDRTRFPSEWGDPKAGITVKEINCICKYPTIGDYLDSCEYTWPRYAEVYDRLPKMFFGAGMKDLCYPKVLEFKEYSEKLGAKNVTFDFVPGYAHEWDFWDLEIVKVMDFFGL